MLNQDDLKKCLKYDSKTGDFKWIICISKKVKVGDIAGSFDAKGYCIITIRGIRYQAHRLVWLYIYGYFPKNYIDHIDGNPKNNRINNLRECTLAENAQNKIAHINSSSKYVGVSWYKRYGKWRARIQLNGNEKSLGYFDTEEQAFNAYKKEKSKLHTFNPIVRSFNNG